MNRKNILIGFAVAVLFSLFYGFGALGTLGDKVYDLFLRFRPEREHNRDVVFLDVDDNSIAYNGVFPWPRSVTANGLLRLKEYGARAAIFDIEFIDKGPQGVDTIYLDQGLSADFDRSFFTEINTSAAELMSAIKSRRISSADIDEYALSFSNLVRTERDRLFVKAQSVARDNDLYLIQSSGLYGRSWSTLNLRPDPLFGEQAERRKMAEERFSYRIAAPADIYQTKFNDILPALPGFSMAAKGAGFTNVEIDGDGIRRRIFLAQNIFDHWYLQLAFAPLINYLGNPEILLTSRRLVIKDAQLPGGVVKDINIPLDGKGRMMLDWPPQDYFDSYKHISFTEFSLMEDLEAELEKFSRALGSANIPFFAQFDPSLEMVPFIVSELLDLFDTIHTSMADALENSSDESFAICVDSRSQSRALIRELLEIDPGSRVNTLIPDLIEAFPESAEAIEDEAGYIATLADYLKINLEKYETTKTYIEGEVKDKFCILGRVDTGTTDIGANPFWGEYVNVGTHGVVLDMILSESFIIPADRQWYILFALVFVLLFLFASAKLAPVPRIVSGLLVTVLIIAVTAAVFRFTGIFFNPLLAVLAMVGAVIVREIISYAGSEREKQFLRKAFSTYVSDEVVKEIIADPSRLHLGGTKRHMSAIFTDIQGFSTISEKLDPESLVSLLNRYLTAMSDVVLEQKGTIDKYEGDAIIAFFGAPVDLSDHALRACRSAIIMKQIERELNKAVMEEMISPSPLFTRIGINTGSMVAGNMGTENKMNYTIMGNAVNLSARLEGVNKQYGTWILAPDDTIREAGEEILTRRLDRVRVVGINEPVQLHELLNIRKDATPKETKLVEVFHQALDYFEKRNWEAAAAGFRESLSIEGRGPSAKFLERCENYMNNPPKDEWDGVYNLTEK